MNWVMFMIRQIKARIYYEVGPLEIGNSNRGIGYREERAWQLAIDADMVRMEWGVDSSVDSTWDTVTLDQQFIDPVVVVSGLYNYTSSDATGECSAEAEAQSVTTASFQVRMGIPEHDAASGCTADPSAIEVHWMVVENTNTTDDTTIPGTSLKIQSGSFTDTDIDTNSSWTFDGNVAVYPDFTNPAVLSSRVSWGEARWATDIATSNTSAAVKMPSSATSVHIHFNDAELETHADFSTAETMHYVIMDTDGDSSVTGTVSGPNGSFFQILHSGDTVRGLTNTVAGYTMGTLDGSFSSPAVAVGSNQERGGSNGAWFFAKSLSSSAWMAWNLEDQDNDTERTHATTYMAGIIFEDAGSWSAATAHSFQRKTFKDTVNSRYWRFYHDASGGTIDIEYSADGSAWTPITALSYDTNDFSVWWKSISGTEYVWIAINDTANYDIVVRAGTLSTTNISWDDDTDIALSGTSSSAVYVYPYITLDSSDYIWVGARYFDGTNYLYRTADSDAVGTTDLSSLGWNTPSTLSDNQTNINVYGSIVALASQDMYAVFVAGSAASNLQGCMWDDDDSGGRWEDSANASCTSGNQDAIDSVPTGVSNNLSAVSDSTNDDVHVAYISDEATDQVSFRRWDVGTTTWDSLALVADAASNDDASVSISFDYVGGDLYVAWIDASADDIFYASCDITSECDADGDWAAETNWDSTGTNTDVTTNDSGQGEIFALWTLDTGTPNIDWDTIIVPEMLWLFMPVGAFIPILLKKRQKKKVLVVRV